jgi:hypothetical protein
MIERIPHTVREKSKRRASLAAIEFGNAASRQNCLLGSDFFRALAQRSHGSLAFE